MASHVLLIPNVKSKPDTKKIKPDFLKSIDNCNDSNARNDALPSSKRKTLEIMSQIQKQCREILYKCLHSDSIRSSLCLRDVAQSLPRFADTTTRSFLVSELSNNF